MDRRRDKGVNMKYPLKLIILFICLFFFLECNPDNLPEQLRPKEKIQDSLDYYTSMKLLLEASHRENKCLDENWDTNDYSQHVELFSNGKMECGGLKKKNTQIYNSSRQLISNQTITAKQDLICAFLQTNEIASNQDTAYSWYKITKVSPVTGEFIMKHTLQKDPNGNVTGIDSFSKYNLGDSLLCCSITINKDNPPRCEKIKYE